jgi:hypothetical protein
MTLAELQARFQAGIIEGDKTILASIADSRKTDRETLFAVYCDAYRFRLAEFLSNDFPVLRDFIGDEVFGKLVEDYIESAPSRQPNARWYGASLPDFMAETLAWRKNLRAIDLARFERALSEAFDAADAPILSVDALRDIRVEDRPRITLEFHPSLRLLDLALGTEQIYDALTQGGEPPAAQNGKETILFWRGDGQACYRPLTSEERLALLEARHGLPFGDICALLAFQRNGSDTILQAAGFLSQWFTDGLVTHVSICD